MGRSRREQSIEQVASIIHDFMDGLAGAAPPPRAWAKDVNRMGWTFDVRWDDGDYVSDTSFTRVEGIVLSDADLESAILMVETWNISIG